MFAYSGGNGAAADEAERNAQMAKWVQWFGQLGSAVVDGGAPTGTAKTVGTGGSVSDGGSRGLTGYSIVSADSLDSAVELAKGCPVLETGGAVEVYEAIDM
ncbi:MAG: YciI family protein [Solirubrobacteraceae bacterium]